jgi:hypothetical protein
MTNPTRATPAFGPALGVVAIGLAAAGLFALPIQAFDIRRGSDVGYVQLHQLAADFSAHSIPGGRTLIGGFAQFWWQWGLLLAGAVVVVAAAATVLLRRSRIPGIVLAVVALATAALHALALHQTSDYRSLIVTFRASGSLYDHSGAGLWLTFVGLALLVLAGAISALGQPAPAPYAAQPPPPPWPAAPPA